MSLLTRDAGPSGAGSFTPASVAGLELWLKADAITGKVDADPLPQWDDASGNARHATEATNPPTYKTAILNSLPVVRFDGVNDKLTVAGITNNDATRTFFAVVKGTGSGVGQRFWTLGASDAALGTSNSATQYFYYANDPGHAVNQLGGNGTVFAVICLRYNSAASMDFFVGTGAATNINPWDTYQSGTSPLIIGSAGAVEFLNGDFAELIVYDSALSEADRASVRDHLRTKYAL